MMRALQITAIVFSLVLIVIAAYYTDLVHSQRMYSYSSVYDMYNSYTSGSSYSSYSYSDSTSTGCLITTVFMLFFLAVHVLSLIKIKTTTVKVFSIIGLVFTGIFLFVAVLGITSDGGISYDEIGPVFILYGILGIAFHVVGTVHAFKKAV